MRKKALAIVMSLAMIFTFMPAMAFAEPEDVTAISYQLSDEREALTVYDYQVEEGWGYYPCPGDQLIVTTSDGEVIYTFSDEEEEGVFLSEDGDKISVQDVTFGNITRASDDAPATIDVEYKGCKAQIPVEVQEVTVVSISFTAKEPKVVYDYECELTEDGYICEPELDEGDSVTITNKDDTSATYILKYEDEGPIWVNDQDEVIPMEDFNIIPASVLVDAADGASFEFDIEYLNVKTKGTVTFKKSPYTDFSFTQSGKYLYVLEECDLAYDETNDEYVLDEANYAEYLGSEGDTLSFTLSDSSKEIYEYGYINDPDYPHGWNGFVTTDASGNKTRLKKEIKFNDPQMIWTKDASTGCYINDSAKVTYMGTVSDTPVVTYVGNMVWFDPNGGNERANFTVPLGMSINDLTKNYADKIPVITRNGYTFDGWYTDPGCTTAFNFDTKITKEITLYAKWTKEKSGNDEEVKPAPVVPVTATVEAAKLPLKTKQKVNAAANLDLPAGVTVKSVTSSNKKVLTVSGTTLRGKKKGKAKVTVTLSNGTTVSYVITVQTGKVKAKITGVPKKLTLHVGQKYQIQADKGYVTCKDKLKYTSSKKKVAKVSKKGLIAAKKKGTTKITVKCGSKKKTIKVKVIS